MDRAREVLLLLATWSYRWTLKHYTILPIIEIASTAVINNEDRNQIAQLVRTWCKSKGEELNFVTVASTVAAAAVIGIFSWTSVPATFWLAQALWYTSFLFSIWAMVLSAQQITHIASMQLPETVSILQEDLDQVLKSLLRSEESSDRETGPRSHVDWNMVYIWQCPTMLMSYAWASFIIALTLHVLDPFIAPDPWPRPPIATRADSKKIAFFYIVLGGLTTLNFAWCSYWSYQAARKPWKTEEIDVLSMRTLQQVTRHGAAMRPVNRPVSGNGAVMRPVNRNNSNTDSVDTRTVASGGG